MEGLTRQISQLATTVNQLKGNQGALPSQVQLNPRENISMITLRSDKELSEPTTQNSKGCSSKASGAESELQKSENFGGPTDSAAQNTDTSDLTKQNGNPIAMQKGKEAEHKLVEGEQSKVHIPSSIHDPKIEIPVLFPRSTLIPQLSKFLKDFIAGKSKKSGKIVMGENVSAVIQKQLPPKCKDLAVYNSLNGVKLIDTRVVIQLADGSCAHPEGLENVLVKVNNFVYPADFYVVKMSGMQSKESAGVLLGRPFLRTTRSVINVYSGTICLDYHGEKFTFNIDDTIKNPSAIKTACTTNVTDPLVQEHPETKSVQDKLESTLTKRAMKKSKNLSSLFMPTRNWQILEIHFVCPNVTNFFMLTRNSQVLAMRSVCPDGSHATELCILMWNHPT
ncbi:uncharacterized protein LOC130998230 [Salvia miltiorrhiza]|uniref:uncharacterized protein LOC130998230 n=1 Tax=Salvia miltiorrhiza TaxID=226208 RepID=UPI0025AD7140|nr:uncharacterized protein LOC130998230 [Salvia miltiorrhiza]